MKGGVWGGGGVNCYAEVDVVLFSVCCNAM